MLAGWQQARGRPKGALPTSLQWGLPGPVRPGLGPEAWWRLCGFPFSVTVGLCDRVAGSRLARKAFLQPSSPRLARQRMLPGQGFWDWAPQGCLLRRGGELSPGTGQPRSVLTLGSFWEDVG